MQVFDVAIISRICRFWENPYVYNSLPSFIKDSSPLRVIKIFKHRIEQSALNEDIHPPLKISHISS